MSSTALLKKFKREVEVTPVPDASNVHLIRPKVPGAPLPSEPQMTHADWDKFEADINKAFEQLP